MKNLQDFLQQVLFPVGNKFFTAGHLLSVLIILVLAFFANRLINKILLPRYFRNEKVVTPNRTKIKRTIAAIIGLLALLGIVWNVGLNYELFSTESWTIRVDNIIEAILIIEFARLMEWIISKALIYNYQRTRAEGTEKDAQEYASKENETSISRTVQYAVYIFAINLLLQGFKQLDFIIFSFQDYTFRISNIFWTIFVLLLAQLLAWVLTQLVLYNYYRNKKINVGSQYAINQLLKYVIYITAVVMALDGLGIKMTVIWGGTAALLVGVGLGLQQTFNDLISGVILLSERTVEIGNVVEINGLVGTVRKIGLRTSIVESRNNITVIVPNSKLTIDNVVNWSQEDDKVRFQINIGVAYGSDTELVKKLLLKVARENVYVMDFPSPFVRMVAFGDSSLDFHLLFWSRNFIVIEDIKSDLRFAIDKTFRGNGIIIPFPQRDVWMKEGRKK